MELNVATAGCEKKYYVTFENIVVEAMAILQSLPCYNDGIDICHLVRYIERNYVVDGDVSNQVYTIIYELIRQGQIEKHCNKYKYLGHFFRLTEHPDMHCNRQYRARMFKSLHRGFFGRIPALSKSKCIQAPPKRSYDSNNEKNAGSSCLKRTARVLSPHTIFYPSNVGGTCDPCQMPKTFPAYDPIDPCSQCDDEMTPIPCGPVCDKAIPPNTTNGKCGNSCDPVNRCYENTISNPQDAVISLPTRLKKHCKDTCSPVSPCSPECEPRGYYQQNFNYARKRPCRGRRVPCQSKSSLSQRKRAPCRQAYQYSSSGGTGNDSDDDDEEIDEVWSTDCS